MMEDRFEAGRKFPWFLTALLLLAVFRPGALLATSVVGSALQQPDTTLQQDTTGVAQEPPGDAVGDSLFHDSAVARTRAPDVVGAVEWDPNDRAGVRGSGLVRCVGIGIGDDNSRATGWGTPPSGFVQITADNRLVASATYRQGIARYALGFGSNASDIVGTGELDPSITTVVLLRTATIGAA